jgi:hypothetical protein
MPDLAPIQSDSITDLPCSFLVIRALLARRYLDSDLNQLLPEAFIPRPDGQDDDGLSVVFTEHRSTEILEDLSLEIDSKFNKTYGMGSLHCGWIRKIDNRLDVVPDPLEYCENHSLIVGVPRQDQDAAVAERLAGQLARIARLIWSPRT